MKNIIAHSAKVCLELLDACGRLVRVVERKHRSAGKHGFYGTAATIPANQPQAGCMHVA